MQNLQVEIEGLEQLQKHFEESPRITAKAVGKAISKSIFTLLGNARKVTPVDQGFLRGAGMVTSFSMLLGVLENVAPYAIYVHEGRAPGRWPPLEAIRPWADRHGIPAFLVARKIFQKGIEPKPFFNDSIEASRNDIDRYFRDALDEIGKSLMN